MHTNPMAALGRHGWSMTCLIRLKINKCLKSSYLFFRVVHSETLWRNLFRRVHFLVSQLSFTTNAGLSIETADGFLSGLSSFSRRSSAD